MRQAIVTSARSASRCANMALRSARIRLSCWWEQVLPRLQCRSQARQLAVMHEIVMAGVIPVAPQGSPSLDIAGIKAIRPHDRNLMAFEHPIEPASPGRSDILRHAGLAPHLVPQMH